MKIFYIADIRFPTERAHGIQIANTCSALAAQGGDVTLVVPKRKGSIDVDPFVFYGLPKNFSVVHLSSGGLSFRGAGKVSFFLRSFFFPVAVYFRYHKDLKSDAIVYGREEILCGALSFFSPNIFWETHMGSGNFFSRVLMNRAKGIICITRGLADFYRKHGVSEDKLLVAADAVDLDKFSVTTESKSILRKGLGLSEKSFIVTYSGSLGLYSWKGADTFLDSLAHIQRKDIVFLLVGGSEKDIKKMKETYGDSRIVFAGQVKPEEVRGYLEASDALVIPNKSGDIISERYTSPMKLFEYMAARKPIIASDLASIREVVSEKEVLFFRPNDAEDLAQQIDAVAGDISKAARRADAAYDKVKEYSWTNRAKKITDFIVSHA